MPESSSSNALLDDLDPEQHHAVTTDSRLVAVIAGAGSGKTRVLTRRVAHRVVTGTADARHTLVLTFTREAAGELRRRLPRLGLSERVTAGTFHGVAHQMLRRRWADLDRRPRGIVDDRRRIVRAVSGGDDLDAVMAELEWAGARGLSPEGYESAVRRGERRTSIGPGRIAEILDAYRREKTRRGVIDLDDLLALLNEELDRHPALGEAVRWQYRHLLVDEAQDLNPLQHRLIDHLRAGVDDLFLVGDPAQAIYGFNGSDPALLLDVSTRFPGVEVVRLPVNHRCTPQVVGAGTHVLRADGQPIEARSARGDGPAVTIVGHDDEHAEAAWVATRVTHLDPTLTRAGRVAILARTHAALAPARAALATAGVTVRRPSAGTRLGSLVDAAYRIASPDGLRQWAQDLAEEGREGADADAAEVASAALDFLGDEPRGDGAAFRAWVGSSDPFDTAVPGVDVLTFHAAKGREWHSTFLVGCESGLVPHRTASTNAARAEEARLLYVAITRATDDLTINWARRRNGYQRRPSPLLDGFVSDTPDPVPPPRELTALERDPRLDALDRLRAWRETTARRGGILPTNVCSDRVLALVAEHRPSNADELDQLTGLGAITARRLFDGIAVALADEPDQARSTSTGA